MNNSNNKIFRSVEFWKSSVMTMPDASFFELMRSVFGKIKTPFNKLKLIEDLKSFLLKENIQKTIASYIDPLDAKVISAIALFGEPACGELEFFFTGELNYAQLQDIIVNLEERFIIYRFTEENKKYLQNTPMANGNLRSAGQVRIALNPVLEKVLLPYTENISSLFPSASAAQTSAETAAFSSPQASSPKAQASPVILNDLVFAGLLSFVAQQESFFRSENIIRKRVIEAGKIRFPKINLSFVLGSLQILGLLYVNGDNLLIDKKVLKDFICLLPQERSVYFAAAMHLYGELNKLNTFKGQQILPPVYRSKIREIANFMHGFLNTLADGVFYPKNTLLKLTEIFKTKTGVAIYTSFLEVLEKTGLLSRKDTSDLNFCLGSYILNKQTAQVNAERPVIAIDSGFSVLLYPEINFTDAIALASVMNVTEAGTTVRFELTKDSAVRAFDKNISAQNIIDLLNRLSGGRLDDALAWNLKDWEKRYGKISLKKGVVLTLAEDHKYLIQTKALAALIVETLADGVYLLSENAMDEAADVLSSAGVDIIGRKSQTSNTGLPFCTTANNSAKDGGYTQSYSNYFPSLVYGESFQIHKPAQGAAEHAEYKDHSIITEKFHNILEKLTLDESVRMELTARINRKLILCENQLKNADVRYEKLEARNMDYMGKQNIAKQAIAMQSPVELERLDGEKIFGLPKSLEKANNSLVLVIVPEEGEESIRIPLAKISLLRRIKKSIFT